MSEPRWIGEVVARAVHARQVEEHGGPPGVRDPGGLQAALERPRTLWHYAETKPDLPALAAAYAVSLTRAHAFLDGNKRASYVLCRLFALLNGGDFEASADDKADTFWALAAGERTQDDLAEWLRARWVER